MSHLVLIGFCVEQERGQFERAPSVPLLADAPASGAAAALRPQTRTRRRRRRRRLDAAAAARGHRRRVTGRGGNTTISALGAPECTPVQSSMDSYRLAALPLLSIVVHSVSEPVERIFRSLDNFSMIDEPKSNVIMIIT